MDYHIKEYYHQYSDKTPHGQFHSVIPLHESPDISWKALVEKVPLLCRGWYELAHLSSADRIEFTRDFWLTKLPYHPSFDSFAHRFFASLDDIGVFITQKKFEDPFEVHLVYSIRGNNGFFSGSLPMISQNQQALEQFFNEYTLPNDYLAFLQIHDGFFKTTDSGVISSIQMPASYKRLQEMIQQHEIVMTSQGIAINPSKLIPFYESFGMPFFQCFWAEWYPENEMGNVYYSGETKTISNVYGEISSSETMAFPTFMDWLMFYLEPFLLWNK